MTYGTLYNINTVDPSHIDYYGNSDYIPPGLTVSNKVPAFYGAQTVVDNPLVWLVGLTASYFQNLNIVQVLNMILFPPVPYVYSSPSLSISGDNTLREVGITFSVEYQLNYTQGDAGLNSAYTFISNFSGSYASFESFTTPNPSQKSTPKDWYTSIPKSFGICGTNSHLAGTQGKDSYGNFSGQAIPAGSLNTTAINQCTFFPFFYGRACGVTPSNVNEQCANWNQWIISGSPSIGLCTNRSTIVAGDPVTLYFNTDDTQKGWVAFPQSLGSQKTPTYLEWQDTIQPINKNVLPGSPEYVNTTKSPALFTQSIVPNVNINGILHTYSLYLFNYGTEVTNPIEFCS